MIGDGFDTEGVFDADYLHFYADALTDERTDAELRDWLVHPTTRF